MLKDGKPYYLTFDETVSLHRQMWGDMFAAYGDNPCLDTRINFKKNWLSKHGYSEVRQNCFLCEYVTQMSPKHRKHHCFMAECPIKWDTLYQDERQGCESMIMTIRHKYACECESEEDLRCSLIPVIGPIYGVAAISNILALPVREKMDWEKEEDLSINRERGE